jgi:sugar porter (SP) family MFS transporter
MKTNNVFYISMIAALGGFLFGYDIAAISGTTASLEEVFGLSKFWLGFTVTVAPIGTIIGTMIIGKPSDKYGRNKMLTMLAILYILSALGSALALNWSMLLVFRFLTGITIGGISVIAPMYIAEISPADKRGRLVVLNQLNVVAAIFLAFLINYLIAGSSLANSWRWMIGVEVIPATIFFFLLFAIPLSPRWLIINNRIDEAREIMNRIGNERTELEIEEVVKSMKEVEGQKNVKLFTKEHRFPIIATILIAFFNQVSGINAIIYYAPRIFEMTGLASDSALLQSIAIGGTNLIFTLLALTVIDKVGRRTLLMAGSVGMVFFLGMIARAFYLESFSGYSVMLYLIGFMAFFAFSQGAVLWVFISEIFPNKVRAKGQALGTFTHWFMAALLALLFPVLANSPAIGGGHSFAFFAIMMTLHFFFAWKVIPETKGKTLEQIQMELAVKNQ